MSTRHLLLLLALPLLCSAVLAQAPGAHWSTTPTTTNPPLRRENPGVSDGVYMYVFGGQSGNSGGAPLNDLWRFDGVTWTEMTANGAAGSPPERDRAGITWDMALNRLVVFGGEDAAGSALGDTWHWDPITNLWSDVTPTGTSPSARKFCALAWDAVNTRVLLFGGLQGTSTHLNDTWVFDGVSWMELAPAGPLPPVRRQHVLVERPDFADVIMCGGQEAGGAGMLGDTWRWDGASWTQIATTVSPAGKVAIDAAYDQSRQRIVIAGGNPGPTGSISEFDSVTNDWVIRPLDPGIYKVTRYFMAYVPSMGKTFKVSGQALNATTPPDLTYEFQSDFVATYTMSGTACAGVAGVPTLVATTPWLDRTFSVTVANVAATEAVTMLSGVDTTSWMGVPLPWDLSAAGYPGCTLYVSPFFITDLGIGTGGAFSFAFPNDPSIYGLQFFNQAILVDTATGAAAFTGLGTGTLGVL